MEVNYQFELDSPVSTEELGEALDPVRRVPPFPRFRFVDQTRSFHSLRSMVEAQSVLRRSLPIPVYLLFFALYLFVVLPLATAFWLWSLPDRVYRRLTGQTEKKAQEDQLRFLIQSERPIAVTALPAVVAGLTEAVAVSALTIETTAVDDDGEEAMASDAVVVSLPDLLAADRARLVPLMGRRVEVRL